MCRALAAFGSNGKRRRSNAPALSTCLVHAPCPELRDDRLEPPLGLLYLASQIRALGHNVSIVDLASQSEAGLDRMVPDGCDIYGFSTYSVNYATTRCLAAAVRGRNPEALLIAGGPHATALPRIVAEDGFDVVVRGEGEVAVLEVLAARATGKALPRILEGQSPSPLDGLPFPDYDLVDLRSYSREVDGHRCISILSSRGCPYRCTFCNSNIMGAGKPIRFRLPDNVVAEIRAIKRRYAIKYFRFQDDTFTIHKNRIDELTPYLAREDIVYRCFGRLNTCAEHPEVPRMLHDSGCVHVSFGVESGSSKILSIAAMHKNQTPDQIRRGLVNAHVAKLKTRIFLIVGFPGETDETVAETLALVKNCPWDEFSVYPLIAYPGTPLHDRPQDFGILSIDANYSRYLQIGRNFKAGFTIRTATFDEHKVHEWRNLVIKELVADGRTWAGNSYGFK